MAKEDFEYTNDAIGAITDKTGAKPNGRKGDLIPDISGEIVCPKCGEKLYFNVHGENNHIWGKCSTDKCLSWMM